MRTSQGDLISRSEREDPLGEIGSLSATSKPLKLGELWMVALLKLLELPAGSFEAGIRNGKILASADVQRSELRQRLSSDLVRPRPLRAHREIVTADADHSPLELAQLGRSKLESAAGFQVGEVSVRCFCRVTVGACARVSNRSARRLQALGRFVTGDRGEAALLPGMVEGDKIGRELALADVGAEIAVDLLEERPTLFIGAESLLQGTKGGGAVHVGSLDVPVIVGDHEPLAFALQVEPYLGKALVQFAPGAGLLKRRPGRRAGIVQDGRLGRALELLHERVGDTVRVFDVGGLLKSERHLLDAQGSHEPGPILPTVPSEMRLGMNTVHHEVDVFVRGVLVRHDERLMTFQLEVP
jgi:hypothetical protein